MKMKSLIVTCGAIALVISLNWMPGLLADTAPLARTPLTPNENRIVPPINRRCVVTLDPIDSGHSTVVAGTANIVTGFAAPNIVEGQLISLNDQWLVIRSATNENWIPRNKILMIHLDE